MFVACGPVGSSVPHATTQAQRSVGTQTDRSLTLFSPIELFARYKRRAQTDRAVPKTVELVLSPYILAESLALSFDGRS